MNIGNQPSSSDESDAWEVLKKVIDPEIGENIIDLGLIYRIDENETGILVSMTMTSPACPMGEILLDEVRAELSQAFPGVEVDIEMVWDPAWHPDMISPSAKARLGWE